VVRTEPAFGRRDQQAHDELREEARRQSEADFNHPMNPECVPEPRRLLEGDSF